LTGEVAGGLATTTGIGAAVGVSTIAVSTTLVVGGAANVAAGIRGLTQSMMSSGSGSSGAQATAPAAKGGGLADLAKHRAELSLKAGEGTLARLDVGGRRFYGINAHGQPVAPLGVNAISATHAEADAFAQAARAGVKGGSGTLYVDRALCSSCGTFGGVRSMARQLGLESLEVVTPGGSFTITP
jgi:filamentous hemagglutinin